MEVRLAPLTLLAGIAAAVGSVAVNQWTPGLVVAVLASLLLLLVAPPGWGTRLPFGLGYAATLGLLSVGRGEGDYVITSSVGGYVVLALGLLVLTVAVATLPRPGRAHLPHSSD